MDDGVTPLADLVRNLLSGVIATRRTASTFTPLPDLTPCKSIELLQEIRFSSTKFSGLGATQRAQNTMGIAHFHREIR